MDELRSHWLLSWSSLVLILLLSVITFLFFHPHIEQTAAQPASRPVRLKPVTSLFCTSGILGQTHWDDGLFKSILCASPLPGSTHKTRCHFLIKNKFSVIYYKPQTTSRLSFLTLPRYTIKELHNTPSYSIISCPKGAKTPGSDAACNCACPIMLHAVIC